MPWASLAKHLRHVSYELQKCITHSTEVWKVHDLSTRAFSVWWELWVQIHLCVLSSLDWALLLPLPPPPSCSSFFSQLEASLVHSRQAPYHWATPNTYRLAGIETSWTSQAPLVTALMEWALAGSGSIHDSSFLPDRSCASHVPDWLADLSIMSPYKIMPALPASTPFHMLYFLISK